MGAPMCSSDTVELNAFINAKTNTKKLQFGEDKCVKMHVGGNSDLCPDVYIDTWKVQKVKDVTSNKVELVNKGGKLICLKK